MTFKLNYDLERNNQLCCPKEHYGRFEGVHYEDTIMITRDDVYFNPHKQPRTSNQNIANIETLKPSFLNKNYDHNYRPVAADIEKENGVYDGVAGWNRSAIFDALGIDVFPVDLLSFDSEYDKHKFRSLSNNEEEHHVAASSMSQVAIKEQIKVSLREDYLPKNRKGQVTDATIRAEIADYTTVYVDGRAAKTISEDDRKKIFKEIRASFPKNNKLQTYNKEVVEIAAKSLDLPIGGFNEKTGKIGYVLTHTVGKDAMWFINYANPEYAHLPVHITFAIETPPDDKEKTIEKRKKLKKSLYDAIDQKAVVDANIYDLDVSVAREKLLNNKKIIFEGFLNSYVDETEGTNKTYVLVDENGNVKDLEES